MLFSLLLPGSSYLTSPSRRRARFLTARTEVDKIDRQVTLLDFEFTKSSFPSTPNNGQDYVNIVKDPITGIVSGGRAGYAGNMYTGNYEAGGKGFAYDTKTGQGATASGLYGDHDGNVYRQVGSGWQQYQHGSGSWASAGGSRMNSSASSRSFGGMRASNFGGFSGARFGGFRR
jgi:hypothetical protein